ncbi:MAG: hypothetical protein EOO78_37540, partial [Oxalobacteraceae bacterium]
AALADPLVFGSANAAWFAQVKEAQRRVQQLQQLGVPLMYVYSDADPVASPAANAHLAQRLQAPHKVICRRPQERHEVLHELQRQELFARIGDFIGSSKLA